MLEADRAGVAFFRADPADDAVGGQAGAGNAWLQVPGRQLPAIPIKQWTEGVGPTSGDAFATKSTFAARK